METHCLNSEQTWMLWGRRAQRFFLGYLGGMVFSLYLYFYIDWFFTLPYIPWLAVLNAGLFTPAAVGFIVVLWGRRKEAHPEPVPGWDSMEWWQKIWHIYHWFLTGALVFGLWSLLYFIANTIAMNRHLASMATLLDGKIPFRSEWVYIYFTVYWVFLMDLLSSPTPQSSVTSAKGYFALIFAAIPVFLLYPVGISRPEEILITKVSDWALILLYASDNPVNCFPSMHCGMAMLSALYLWRRSRFLGYVGMGLAVAVGFSTLFTKQHYILDVLSGFGLAGLLFALSSMTSENSLEAMRLWRQLHDRLEHFRNSR